MLVDTHAHVNFNAYKDDSDEVVRRALEGNIWMINVGSQIDTARRAVEFAQQYSVGVYAAVGLHPIHLRSGEVDAHVDEYEIVQFASRAEEFNYEEYKKLAKDPKVVAIGEIGLDYYHIDNSKLKNQNSKLQVKIQNLEEVKNLQKQTFIKQLELASELNKPVIIHCREAHNDVLEILQSAINNRRLTIKGVVHSFSGRWSQAQQYLEMGFYLGFNGIITFARDYDRVVKEMPLDRLVLETDCPYLTPVPFRGKRNEPSYVKYVAQQVAGLRNISYDEIAGITTKNARELFKI